MGIDYIYRADQRLMIVVWDGMIKAGQWRAHLIRIFADPDFRRAEIQLTDLRYSTIDPSISDNAIYRAVGFLVRRRELIAQKKLAIVAGSEWEKPKLVEHLIQHLTVRPIVFTNLVTACTWLNLDVVDIGQEIQQIRLELRHNT